LEFVTAVAEGIFVIACFTRFFFLVAGTDEPFVVLAETGADVIPAV
jgi:hypothetical protein